MVDYEKRNMEYINWLYETIDQKMEIGSKTDIDNLIFTSLKRFGKGETALRNMLGLFERKKIIQLEGNNIIRL